MWSTMYALSAFSVYVVTCQTWLSGNNITVDYFIGSNPVFDWFYEGPEIFDNISWSYIDPATAPSALLIMSYSSTTGLWINSAYDNRVNVRNTSSTNAGMLLLNFTETDFGEYTVEVDFPTPPRILATSHLFDIKDQLETFVQGQFLYINNQPGGSRVDMNRTASFTVDAILEPGTPLPDVAYTFGSTVPTANASPENDTYAATFQIGIQDDVTTMHASLDFGGDVTRSNSVRVVPYCRTSQSTSDLKGTRIVCTVPSVLVFVCIAASIMIIIGKCAAKGGFKKWIGIGVAIAVTLAVLLIVVLVPPCRDPCWKVNHTILLANCLVAVGCITGLVIFGFFFKK